MINYEKLQQAIQHAESLEGRPPNHLHYSTAAKYADLMHPWEHNIHNPMPREHQALRRQTESEALQFLQQGQNYRNEKPRKTCLPETVTVEPPQKPTKPKKPTQESPQLSLF